MKHITSEIDFHVSTFCHFQYVHLLIIRKSCRRWSSVIILTPRQRRCWLQYIEDPLGIRETVCTIYRRTEGGRPAYLYTIEGQLCKIADSCPLLCRSLVELIEISYYWSSATAEAKLARKTNELNKDMQIRKSLLWSHTSILDAPLHFRTYRPRSWAFEQIKKTLYRVFFISRGICTLKRTYSDIYVLLIRNGYLFI